MDDKHSKQLSRRDAIKLLGAAAGASVLANLPAGWTTPELTLGVLPAHARTSGQCTDYALHVLYAPGSSGSIGYYGNFDIESQPDWYWTCAVLCCWFQADAVAGANVYLQVTVNGFDLPLRHLVGPGTYWIYVDTPSGHYREGSSGPVLPPAGSDCPSVG
jgi:hypothetical protein